MIDPPIDFALRCLIHSEDDLASMRNREDVIPIERLEMPWPRIRCGHKRFDSPEFQILTGILTLIDV